MRTSSMWRVMSRREPNLRWSPRDRKIIVSDRPYDETGTGAIDDTKPSGGANRRYYATETEFTRRRASCSAWFVCEIGQAMSVDQLYLNATHELYRQAALRPETGLCCTTTPIWQLPGLSIPQRMQQMNYGCGSTVHPRDLVNNPTVLYVGVGGGMELLQFAYFSRRPGAIMGVDLVDEMLATCRANLREAEGQNPWFRSEFVDLRRGDALRLPVTDS